MRAAALVLLASLGCQAAKPAADPTDPEQLIGSLQWEITEAATGKILGEGRRQIRLKDVAFSVSKLTRKQIPLSDRFVLGMAESPDRNKADKKGFGLILQRDDLEKVASWEWFIVNYEDHAYKLQEEASLRIRLAKVGAGWEVTRTEFLSDASLRAMAFDTDRPPDAFRPTWRARIFKGSFVNWPSLVDGKAVANP